MATLKKRRGKWYARIRRWNGVREIEKQIPLRTDSKVTARIRLQEIEKVEQDIIDGMTFEFQWHNADGKLKVSQQKLSGLVDEYLVSLKSNGAKDSTISRARYCLKNMENVFGSNFIITDINAYRIEYFKQIMKDKLTDNGININLTRIRAFLNWCHDIRELITKRPKIVFIKVPKKNPSYLTENNLTDIFKLDWLSPFYKNVFRMYLDTGMRLREPFNGIIDNGWLIVSPSDSKTGIVREIEVSPYHIETIGEMLLRMESSKSTFKAHTDYYSKVFKKVVRNIGRGDLHFHNLTDTFAVIRYLETRDIYQVSKELGHTTVKVTEKYAKFRMSKLEQDFPSLGSGYNRKKVSNYGFRDTDIRDTNQLSLTVHENIMA